MRVNKSKMPKKYLTYCIHFPGFGRKETREGNKTTTKQGMLIPIPMAKKILIKIKDDWVNATVMAVPTKGAEQGVAIIVAKKPLKKFLINLL